LIITGIDQKTAAQRREEVMAREPMIDHETEFVQTIDELQEIVSDWVISVFGIKSQTSTLERCMRLMEESTETGQSGGISREQAHAVVDMVFNKPVDPDISKEIGGVIWCVAALCDCQDQNFGKLLIKAIEECSNPERQAEIKRNHLKKVALGVGQEMEA
jgi:hypothetical protein